MKPAPFDYVRPATLDEALAAYAAAPEAKILAGGQSLIPLLSMRLMSTPLLIDINGIAELGQLHADDDGVRFGAIVRHTQLIEDGAVAHCQPLVPLALGRVAHPTIRNRGTTVGSIVHADAAAEMPTVFALLGGTLAVVGPNGKRTIEARDLFVEQMQTCLEAGEIAVECFLPRLAPHSGIAFDEVARRNGDYALCGVAAIVDLDASGAIEAVRASYLSVCETPVVVDLSSPFAGGELTGRAVDEAVQLALDSLDPASDVHATADYRQNLIRVLTARAIGHAHTHAANRQMAEVR